MRSQAFVVSLSLLLLCLTCVENTPSRYRHLTNTYQNNGAQYEESSFQVNIENIAEQTVDVFVKLETFLKAYEEWKQSEGFSFIKTVINDIPTIQALANSLPQIYPEYGDFNVTYEDDSEQLSQPTTDYPLY
ncbi:unnamed protein product [Trichobilharzia regenti]|nr:unnamed protein product [Trichobilharzia regenti]